MLDKLYQQTILAHNKKPIGYGVLNNPDSSACGHNPVCGDHVEIGLWFHDKGEGKVISHAGFDGESCAICTASASILCEQLKGMLGKQANAIAGEFMHFLSAENNALNVDNKLQVFSALHEMPTRRGCASLPWEALQSALLKAGCQI